MSIQYKIMLIICTAGLFPVAVVIAAHVCFGDETLVVAVAAALVLCVVVGYFAGRSAARPMRNLISGARAVAEGNFDLRIPDDRDDEIGALAKSINSMTESMKNSCDEAISAWKLSDNIMQTLSESLLVVDTEGRVQMANRKVESLSGHSLGEIYRRGVEQLLSDGQGPITVGRLSIMATGPVIDHEARFLRREGPPVPVNISVSRLKDESNKEIGHVLLVKDMRDSLLYKELQKTHGELRELHDQLIQSEKLAGLGQLTAGIAHELNNPLTGIIGFTQILAGKESDPQNRKYLERVLTEGDRCKKIVQNLLCFARKDTGAIVMASINEIVAKAADIVSYALKIGNIRVTMELDRDLPPTAVDPFQFQQAFLNMITNAADAMSGGGVLTIRTSHHEGRIRIQFVDTGTGIKPEHLQKIFDPFFTTKEVGRGTGLGLSVVYGIVKAHEGDIAVGSVVGGGTTFTMTLPVRGIPALGTPAVRPDSPAPTPVGPPRRILVVDDEDSILEIWKSMLNEGKFDVTTVSRGAEALALLKQREFDLVISDIKMPALKGWDIYNYICEHLPVYKDRILFVTGDTVSKESGEFLARHSLPHLVKPFDLSVALETVRNMLARKEPV